MAALNYSHLTLNHIEKYREYAEDLVTCTKTSCCGTMEQFRATEGALNTLKFKKKKTCTKLTSLVR